MGQLIDSLPEDLNSFDKDEYQKIYDSVNASEKHRDTDAGVMMLQLATQALNGDPFAKSRIKEVVRQARSPFLKVLRVLED